MLLKKLIVMLALFGLVLFSSQNANAAFVSLGGTNYFQNFNSLSSQGKSSTLPAGWAFQEFGVQNNKIRPNNGSSAAAGVYSYGLLKDEDRALGTLRADGTKYGMFGASFQNTSGGPLNSLNISYTGEEWRLGAEGRGQDRLQFQYSLNASSLGSGTWINVPTLDFLTPNLLDAGAHNGNLAANQTFISGSISFLNIPVGGTFWVRWVDVALPHGGPEDGLAVDNFSISAVPEASTWGAALAAVGLLGALVWKRR